ncbi:MAG: hypothetical protein IKE43_07840 [Coriobacteriales bacterium]|nr:hypothetical protein [Coriobacteriales bacterium]
MKTRKLLFLILSLSLTLTLLAFMTPAVMAAGPVMGDDPEQPTDDYCPVTSDGIHSWDGRETAIQTVTCTTEGIYNARCGRCGYETILTVPARGHDWGEWFTVEEASCVEPGVLMRVCNRCGEEEYQVTSLAPHTFSDWYIVTEANDWSAGIQEHVCVICGTTE